MKHNIQTLKKNLTMAELWEIEKELKEKMTFLKDWDKNMCQESQYSRVWVWGRYDLIKEILGDE